MKKKLPWPAHRVPHAIGVRCAFCAIPILLVLHPDSGRRVPIEISAGWDGSIFYVKGKHRYHGISCERWDRWVKKDSWTEV